MVKIHSTNLYGINEATVYNHYIFFEAQLYFCILNISLYKLRNYICFPFLEFLTNQNYQAIFSYRRFDMRVVIFLRTRYDKSISLLRYMYFRIYTILNSCIVPSSENL